MNITENEHEFLNHYQWYRFIFILTTYLIIIYFLDDEPVEKEDELNELYHEASMPIEDLISKYKNKVLEHIHSIAHANDQAGSSKSSCMLFVQSL